MNEVYEKPNHKKVKKLLWKIGNSFFKTESLVAPRIEGKGI